jgi:hypothetical protein
VAEVKLRGALSLADLIESYSDVGRKEAIVGSFCALLELVRLQVVQVSQPRTGADIAIELKAEHAQDIEELVAESGLGDEEAREGWDQDARNGGNGIGHGSGSDPLAPAEPQ